MKKVIFILFVAALFGACNTTTKTDSTEQKSATQECSSISVDSFLVVAADYLGKEVTVKGTVDHVCKHGGKRVKIFSSCPTKSIHGEAVEAMGNFKVELEGSDVCLTGIVAESRMDMTYVEEYEAKIKEAIEEEKDEADMEHKEGVDHHAKLDQIAEWKAEIEASEKGYLSTYYLEVSKFHECSSDAKAACCDKDKEKPCCDKSEKSEEKVAEGATAGKSCCDEKEEDKPCAHGE